MSSSSLAAIDKFGRPAAAVDSMVPPEPPHLEKYVRHLFYKVCQIVVQSRQGGRTYSESDPNPNQQSWFCLAVSDNSEITYEAKKVIRKDRGVEEILANPLCVEISLKTIEGDSLVLESWVLSWQEVSDPNIKMHNTVYYHMGLLLKSLLCVTRATPAYRLSRRQGPETFVICYRIYSGEPCTSQLGDNFQTASVGQVVTKLGAVHLRVDYRTQMTITPSCSFIGNPQQGNLNSGTNNAQQTPWSVASPTTAANQQHQLHLNSPQTAALSSTTTSSSTAVVSQPIQVKSDHFHPDTHYYHHRNRTNTFSESEAYQTSDESQEAMKMFAASPPDPTSPFVRRQRLQGKPGFNSSNESLSSGQHRFYRPRSGTNQSQKSEGDDSKRDSLGEFKPGAFVTPHKAARLSSGGVSNESDLNDLLPDLFSVDDDGGDEMADEKSSRSSTTSNNLRQGAGTGSQAPTAPKDSSASSSPLFIDRRLGKLCLQDQQPSATGTSSATVSSTAVRKLTLQQDQPGSSSSGSNNDAFVMLDFQTPFATKVPDDPKADLGIFFKPAPMRKDPSSVVSSIICSSTPMSILPVGSSKAGGAEGLGPQGGGVLASVPADSQLMSLDEELSEFEKNLEEYDDMLRTLEVTATSESESDFN